MEEVLPQAAYRPCGQPELVGFWSLVVSVTIPR